MKLYSQGVTKVLDNELLAGTPEHNTPEVTEIGDGYICFIGVCDKTEKSLMKHIGATCTLESLGWFYETEYLATHLMLTEITKRGDNLYLFRLKTTDKTKRSNEYEEFYEHVGYLASALDELGGNLTDGEHASECLEKAVNKAKVILEE